MELRWGRTTRLAFRRVKQHLRQVGRICIYGIVFGADDRRRGLEQKQRAGKDVRAAAKAAIVVKCPERLGFNLRRQIQAYHSALPRTRKGSRRANARRR
jgi:hypothetical protein